MLTTLLRFVIEHASSFQDCWFFFLTFVGATITQVFHYIQVLLLLLHFYRRGLKKNLILGMQEEIVYL